MHPNAEMLRRNYDAFSRGDVEPMIESFTDEIRWHVSGRSPVAGDYVGTPEVLRFFGSMMELYGGTLQLEVVDVFADDTLGVVVTEERAQYAGKPLEYTGIHRWALEDGKVVAFQNYTDDIYDEFWAREADSDS